MMSALTEILLVISNTFLVPCIFLLFAFFAITVVFIGGMAAEAVSRYRRGCEFARLVSDLKAQSGRTIRPEEVPARSGLQAKAFRESAADRGKVMDDLQMEVERLLDRLHLGVRLGPMLGLAGTLIPLGPALMALTTGDIATLSSRLVVAFTTTVLGILVGGACFVMYAIRRRWYIQDLNDIEFVFTRIKME